MAARIFSRWVELLNKTIEAAGAAVGKTGVRRGSGTGEVAPVWVADAHGDECMLCKTGFGLFNRKHHCRRCEDTFYLICNYME